jgi:hypothetical protein
MSPAPTTSRTALIAGATFVARFDTVIFRVRNRHEKRQDSQYDYSQPHNE